MHRATLPLRPSSSPLQRFSSPRSRFPEADQKFLEWGTSSVVGVSQRVAEWGRDTDVGRFCTARLQELQPTIKMVLAEGAGYVGKLQTQSSSLFAQSYQQVSQGVAQGADLLGKGVNSTSQYAQVQLGQTVDGLKDFLGGVYTKVPEVYTILGGVAEQGAQVLTTAGEAASDRKWEAELWIRKLTKDLSFTAWAYKQGQRVGAIKDPVVAEYQKAGRQASKAWRRPGPFWQRVLEVAGIYCAFALFVMSGILYWVRGWCLARTQKDFSKGSQAAA